MNNQTPVSVTAVPFNPQTQSFTPTPVQPVIQPVAPTIPTLPQGNLPEPSPVITADSLQTKKINIPTNQTVTAVPQPTEQINQAEEIIQKTAQQETEAQKTDRSLSKILFDIAPNLQGQGAEQALQEKRLGRDEKLLQLNALSNEIRMKDAELRQDEIKLAQSIQNIEDKPIAMEFITGQQQSVARNAQLSRALKLSERDMLNARAIGLQGDIALAESMAKKAVETKYAPWKELIETIRMQQEALKPTLAADEKKQLREQEIKTKLAFNDIAKREKNETDISQMLVQASAQGAPSSLTEKAKLAKTPAEAASILGMYAGDYWGTKAKIAQYNKTVAETAANYGGGTSTIGTAPGKSVAQSWLAQYNAGTMSLEDIYTKIGNSKSAESVKNELSRLVAAQGGKRVIPMDDAQISAIDEQIKNINDLVGENGYNYKIITGGAQGGFLGLGASLSGAKGDSLAMAKNLVNNQTLQALADAKAKGITFGALSEGELNTVAGAAGRISAKAIRDDKGNITGFSGSESEFKKDLDTLKTGLEASKQRKTGLVPFGGTAAQKADVADKVLSTPTESTGGYTFGN